MHLIKHLINKLSGRQSVLDFSIQGENLRLSIDSANEIARAKQVGAQTDLINAMRNTITTGDTIFDVGSNSGLLSLLLAKHDNGLDSTVHCFEPEPKKYQQLLQNIEHNRVLGQFQAHKVALWAENGTADLLIPDKNRKGESNAVAVQLQTMTAFSEEHNVLPDIVTIYMKSAAGQVLAGMENLMNNQAPTHIFLQIHPNGEDEFMPDGTTRIESWLTDLGYSKTWRNVCSLGEQCHFKLGESAEREHNEVNTPAH